MKKVIALTLGKILYFFGNLIGRGSVLPGHIALKIDNDLTKELVLPQTIIAVTGSSGKGSISLMLAKLFKAQGYKVVHNEKGSNLKDGIMSTLIHSSNLLGKIKKDVLIFEIDERYAKYVFPDIKPNYVVISNITRDQPPRNGHFDLVITEIKKALTTDMHLIINADDPLLQVFVTKDQMVTYYGLDHNKNSYKTSLFENLNLVYCPVCEEKLEYNYYHFENIGDYYCHKCDFKRKLPSYSITNLDYDKSSMTINNKYKIHIPQDILYCVYNTTAAFTTGALVGLDKTKMGIDISEISNNTKLYDAYLYDNHKIYTLNNKNENSSTFNQSLLFLNRFKGKKTVIIGWKEISRRYKFDDLSWLYDIDFEILNNHDVDTVICVGIHKYDIAARIKNAGIDIANIKTFDDLKTATTYLKTKTKGDIFAILNFDYVEPFNTLMKGGK